jgi:hypothetical protein
MTDKPKEQKEPEKPPAPVKKKDYVFKDGKPFTKK